MDFKQRVIEASKQMDALWIRSVGVASLSPEEIKELHADVGKLINSGNVLLFLHAVFKVQGRPWNIPLLRLIASFIGRLNQELFKSELKPETYQRVRLMYASIIKHLLQLLNHFKANSPEFYDYASVLFHELSMIRKPTNSDVLKEEVDVRTYVEQMATSISEAYAADPEISVRQLSFLLSAMFDLSEIPIALFIAMIGQEIHAESIPSITRLLSILKNTSNIEIKFNEEIIAALIHLLELFVQAEINETNLEMYDVLLELVSADKTIRKNESIKEFKEQNFVLIIQQAMKTDSENIWLSAMRLSGSAIYTRNVDEFLGIEDIFNFLVINLKIDDEITSETPDVMFYSLYQIAMDADVSESSNNREAAIDIIRKLAILNISGLVSIMSDPTEEYIEEFMFLFAAISPFVKRSDNQEITVPVNTCVLTLLGADTSALDQFQSATYCFLLGAYAYLAEDYSGIQQQLIEFATGEDQLMNYISIFAIKYAVENGVDMVDDSFLIPAINEYDGNYLMINLLSKTLTLIIANKKIQNQGDVFQYIMAVTDQYFDYIIENATNEEMEKIDKREKDALSSALPKFIENYKESVDLEALHQSLAKLFANDCEDDVKTSLTEEIFLSLFIAFSPEEVEPFVKIFIEKLKYENQPVFRVITLNRLLLVKHGAIMSANAMILETVDNALEDHDYEDIYDIGIFVSLLIQIERIPIEKAFEVSQILVTELEEEDHEDKDEPESRKHIYLHALALIASALVLKNVDPGELIQCLHEVIQSSFLIPRFSQDLFEVAIIHIIQSGNEGYQELRDQLTGRNPEDFQISPIPEAYSSNYDGLNFPEVARYNAIQIDETPLG
jgi:hypothetical protein